MKKIKNKKARGLQQTNEEDPFELFMTNTEIDWCYYKDTHRVLGQTYDMLILQDFEAMTPNILARTIETISGGGSIILLFHTVTTLKQLYTLRMDVHGRYRMDDNDFIPRFNERFILSLSTCRNCLVCDDELNILPLTCKNDQDEKYKKKKELEREMGELKQLQEELVDTPHIGAVVGICKTLDQAHAVVKFLECCTTSSQNNANPNSVVALTAARGRGKSAAIGLCLAGAISLGYSNICVTAPDPENVLSVFEFLMRGLDALKYRQHQDYDVTYSNASGRDALKCILSVEIYKEYNRQTVVYHSPSSFDKFVNSELIAIDEAAAIPLPYVRSLINVGSRLTFLSSTVNGYEGTGRALSLKLVKELRGKGGGREFGERVLASAADSILSSKGKRDSKVHEKRWEAAAKVANTASNKSLTEIELSTPIRYAHSDPVEYWLNQLLCLDCTTNTSLQSGTPPPKECELYQVHRDALFSYHSLSESFLQKVWGLYTSAHYKNSPNDLQMLSDAPAHEMFVLLHHKAEKEESHLLPDILVVIQVAFEGKISRKTVEAQLARGHRSAGDLIPWTISQQFGDSNFAELSGVRIVRIAVHPTLQGMGYGSRAMELLGRFYNGEMIDLVDAPISDDSSDEEEENDEEMSDDDDDDDDKPLLQSEKLAPKKQLPPLLIPLTEVKPPKHPLHWIGTSFGLTYPLHSFWSKHCQMKLLYLRQTPNDLTGEYSTIMIRALSDDNTSWLKAFAADCQRRIISLLSGSFRDLDSKLALSILTEDTNKNDENTLDVQKRSGTDTSENTITTQELHLSLTHYDLKRLEQYGRNLCDHHLISDLLPNLARLYFLQRLHTLTSPLTSVQSLLLCSIGLQHKTVDEISGELGLPMNQILAMFNKTIRKLSIALNSIVEQETEQKLLSSEKRQVVEQSTLQTIKDVTESTLQEDITENAKEVMDKTLSQYEIKGSEEQWANALKNGAGKVQIATVVSNKEKVEEEQKFLAEQKESELKKLRDGIVTKKKKSKKRKGRSSV